MFHLAIFFLLGTIEASPPQIPPPPSASNSVNIKTIDESFQNSESPNCETDEVYKEGSCQPMLKQDSSSTLNESP